jgi:hypothetical protein
MLEPDPDARPADLAEHAKQLRRCATAEPAEILIELVHERAGRKERAVAQTLRAAAPAPVLTDRLDRPEPPPTDAKTKLERAPLPSQQPRPTWVPFVIVAALGAAVGAAWFLQANGATPDASPDQTIVTTTEPTLPVTAPPATALPATSEVAPAIAPPVTTEPDVAPATTVRVDRTGSGTRPRVEPPATVATETTMTTSTPTTVEPPVETSMTATTMMGPTPITEVEEEW